MLSELVKVRINNTKDAAEIKTYFLHDITRIKDVEIEEVVDIPEELVHELKKLDGK